MKRAAIALIVVLAPTLSAAQVSLLELKNSLVQFALEQISTPDEFVVTAAGVEEPEDGVTDLVELTIADGRGVWLTAERLSMRWNPSRLLAGQLEINQLAAIGVRVLRSPEPSGVDIELNEDSAFAQSDGDPFDWPRSPIALLVEEIALVDMRVAGGVLSPQPVALDANGAFRDEGSEQSARLDVTRTDAIEGEILLDYLRDFDAETLRLNISAAEAAGGLTAALAGLPDDSASRLEIEADGPLSDWRIEIGASADAVFEADGAATLSNEGRLAVAASFQVTPGDAMDQTLAQALSPQARIDVRIEEGDNGLVVVEEGALRARDIDLTVRGSYAKPTRQMDFSVAAEARAGLANLTPGVTFDRVAFDGAVEGALDAFKATGALSLNQVATTAADIGAAEFTAEVDVAGARVACDLSGDASAMRLDRLTPDAIGPARLTTIGFYDDGRLELTRASLRSDLLTADLDGRVDVEGALVEAGFTLDAPDVAAIGSAYDLQTQGAVQLRGDLTGPMDRPALAGVLTATGAAVDGASLGDVEAQYDFVLDAEPAGAVVIEAANSVVGDARLSSDLALRDARLSLAQTRLTALGVEIDGSADVLLDSNLISGSAIIRAPDLDGVSALVGEAITGSARGRIDFSPTPAGQDIVLDLDLANVAASAAQARSTRLDVRASDAFGDVDLDARVQLENASAGEVAFDQVRLAAAGRLSALAVSLEAAGAAGDVDVAAGASAELDLGGDATSLEITQAEAAYGQESFALMAPLIIRIGGDATRFEELALSLPGGAVSGAAALFSDGVAGDLSLRMRELSLFNRLDLAPIESGSLTAEATFDTRPQSAAATLRARSDGVSFETAVDEGAIALDAQVDWDGRRATALASLMGPFGEPLRLSGAAPLIARGGLLPTMPENAALEGGIRWTGDVGDLWVLVPAPDHVLDGALDVDLRLFGSIDAPQLSGDLALRQGRYENLELGLILTDVEARSSIADDGGCVVDLNAEDGAGGPVSGRAAVADGEIDAALSSQSAILIRRDDITAQLTLDLSATGPLDGPVVAGAITIDRAEARLVSAGAPTVPDLGEIRIKGQEPVAEDRDQAVSRTTLDVTIVAAGDLFIRGRGLDSEWRANLTGDGPATAPRGVGEVERLRGQLNLLGSAFDMERGRIAFAGATPPDPTVDLLFTRENDEIVGGVLIEGPAAAPDIRFTSQPAIPEEDVLPRVLFGRSKQSLSPVEAVQLANGLATLFNGEEGVVDQVRGAVGLDVLRFDQQEGSTGVVAGRDIAEDVFVGVRQPIDGGAAQVEIEIEVFEEVTVDSAGGADSGSSLGVNWKRDF
ncbi:MAG: translocation/assembly module TamB domain-containing protein [Neomegalonema sp.]